MGISNFIQRAYDAISGSNRRRRITIDTRSEDRLFMPLDRDQLISNARSLKRNASIAAWAIRKHQDYVSTFSFQCRSKDPVLNQKVEDLMEWWSRPFNFDVSGRFSMRQFIRMAEGLRTVDGDCFIYKMSDGRVQLIEGDRVRTPTDFGEYQGQIDTNQFSDLKRWVHGVEVSDSGAPRTYAICDRSQLQGQQNGFVLRDMAQAGYVYHLAYRDFRYDQIRGISPLASAINQFCDIYEAEEYALAKMKLSQFFALKFIQDATDSEDQSQPLSFDFSAGPQFMNLNKGEDASFLESNTPSMEFQAFMTFGIQAALKSLDIPYCTYDESHTNYSGSRIALQQYEQSAEAKREDLRTLLNAMTAWRLSLFIADGHLTLPEGMTLDDLKWEWVSRGVPWIDPMKEIAADVMAVKAGFTSRQRVVKANGEDWREIVRELKDEKAELEAAGLNGDIENVTIPDSAFEPTNKDVAGKINGGKNGKQSDAA